MDGFPEGACRLRTVPHRAMALLVVMVLTMLIALGAYRYSFTMQAQYRLTRIHEDQVQARLAAHSGLEVCAMLLEGSLYQQEQVGGLESNPALFQHILIDQPSSSIESSTQSSDERLQWHVSLLSPAGHGPVNNDSNSSMNSLGQNGSSRTTSHLRFGLESESAKLHIPTLLRWERQFPGHARAALLRLPNAQAESVDDWLRQQGVSPFSGTSGESRLMDRMQSGDSNRDRQSSSDWFRLQWLGGDFNQNYQLDTLELAITESLQGDDEGARTSTQASNMVSNIDSSSLAWQRYLTWHSGERNESRSGQPRINLNADNLQDLHRQLLVNWPVELANFVIAARQYGPGQPVAQSTLSAGSGNNSSGAATDEVSPSAWAPDFGQPAPYKLSSVLQLMDVRISVPVTGDSNSAGSGDSSTSSGSSGSIKKRWLSSPFLTATTASSNYNERLLDEVTVEPTTSLAGRIDFWRALPEVLASIPGIDLQLADQIVQRRDAFSSTSGSSASSMSQPANGSILWLLNERLVDLDTLKKLEPYLTNRSDVYRTQAIGYRDALTPVYRCTAVIDARQRPAQIIDHQVWHTWDRGFPIVEFASTLRENDR